MAIIQAIQIQIIKIILVKNQRKVKIREPFKLYRIYRQMNSWFHLEMKHL